jgi:hypothetical protein
MTMPPRPPSDCAKADQQQLRGAYADTARGTNLSSATAAIGYSGTPITMADPILCTPPSIPLGVRYNELYKKHKI